MITPRFRSALRKFDQVLDITPDDLDTLANKAAIAQAEGDLPRAAALLAPLHPNADDTTALEIQVYQAILERRPAQIIPRLKEILANPDSALGFTNCELRFWLGWAQQLAGDHAAAQESWRQARSELESFLKELPENSQLIDDLALTNIGLGDKPAALALAERAMAASPIEKDALQGPAALEILARVAAQMGESDRAIAALEKLLLIPYGCFPAGALTPALLRLDPMFDPLRNDPRFQKLVATGIAVLPFENRSEDKANAYFADAIQDEILTRLSKIADLKVISRTSTQHYKRAPENLPQIAKQLGVTHILEGSVQKVADQVRVNVQLINAMTDAHLWAETYDRKLTDIFAVESDIAKTIAETLQAKITGSEKKSIAKAPTANPEAYELYLKGRFFWNKRTGEDLHKAIGYFEQAIAKDPDYALAYVGSADSYLLLSSYSNISPRESLPPARAALEKALALDDSLAEAHASFGLLDTLDLNLQHALVGYQRAIDLKPNYATAHHWLALGYATLGQFDPGIAEAKRAIELDPLSLIINADCSWIYFNARRFDEAEAQARKTLEMDSRFFLAHYYQGAALQFKGQVAQAIPEYQTAFDLNHDLYSLAMLGQAYARNRQKEEARKILARLSEEAKSHYVAPYALALVQIPLGNKDRAIEELEQAYAKGETNYLFVIKTDPLLDDLRGQPRFDTLVQKIVGGKR